MYIQKTSFPRHLKITTAARNVVVAPDVQVRIMCAELGEWFPGAPCHSDIQY